MDDFENHARTRMIAEVRRRKHRRRVALSGACAIAIGLAYALIRSLYFDGSSIDTNVDAYASEAQNLKIQSYLEVRTRSNAHTVVESTPDRLLTIRTHNEIDVQRIQAWELFTFVPGSQIQFSPEGHQTLIWDK